MPSLTSQSCGDSLLAVYLAGQVGAIYRPVNARQARECGLSKSRLLNLWQWYKHELYIVVSAEWR